MSSSYVIICASHDPAIEITEHVHVSSEVFVVRAYERRVPGHERCDLLVGRYSGGLVEIACPGGKPCVRGYHNWTADTWTDVGWLRLLWAAHERGDDVDGYRIPHCWTQQRVMRLGPLLGMVHGGES